MEAGKRATSTSTIDSSVQAVLIGTIENVHLNNLSVHCQSVLKFICEVDTVSILIYVEPESLDLNILLNNRNIPI